MFDFKKYVDSHTIRQLTQGKIGAEIRILDDHKIAKFVEKARLLILCDWQSVSLNHPASDIAFFMSRLQGDGISFDENKSIDSYCRYSKNGITKDEIKTQMYLASINTTFRYWHYYLHGSPKSVVENIVENMLGETK